MLMLRGLGALPSAMTAMQATTGYRAGGAAPLSPGKTGPTGWTRWGLNAVLMRDAERQNLRTEAVRANLLAKYGAQIPSAKDVYGNTRLVCDIDSRGRNWLGSTNGYHAVRDPIGVINVLDVPFSADMLKDDPQRVLEAEFTPSPEQRFRLNWQLYAASQRALMKRWGYDMAAGTDALLDLTDPKRGIGRITSRIKRSVGEMLAQGYVTSAPGFMFPSIEPTEEELTSQDGLGKFYARGGFLLDPNHLTGRSKIATTTLRWNEGYVMCDGRVVGAPMYNRGDNGSGWQVYLTVSPTTYKLRVSARDAPWWAEMRDGVGGIMQRIWRLTCQNKDLIAAVGSDTLAAEACIDGNGKACTKGTPGCTCVPVGSPEQMAVAVGTGFLARTCNRATTTGPVRPKPFAPEDAPPPTAQPGIPLWGWLLAGGLAAGAVALARK